jgi:hypothetical protein
LNVSEAGRMLGISSSTAHRHWMFARAWLHEAAQDDNDRSVTDRAIS